MRGGFQARSRLIVINRRKTKGGGMEKMKSGRNMLELTVVRERTEVQYSGSVHKFAGDLALSVR